MTIHIQFHDGAILERESPQATALTVGDTRLNLNGAPEGILDALEKMCKKGSSLDELEDVVLGKENTQGLAHFFFFLERLKERGLICKTLVDPNKTSLVTLAPCSEYFREEDHELPEVGKLSRFAFAAMDHGVMVLESPAAQARVLVHDPRAMAVFYAFSNTRKLETPVPLSPELPADQYKQLIQFFMQARLIVAVNEEGVPEEDNQPPLCQWEFHDLLHLINSRQGRRKRIFGGSYRFRGTIASPQAIPDAEPGETLTLHQPILQEMENTDPPFVMVHEARQSIREFGEEPLSGKQLGEFLYRVARTRQVIDRGEQELLSRPYPSSGGVYELEIYPLIKNCDGIPNGLYHYCSQSHHLAKQSPWNSTIEKLFQKAVANTGARNAQVLMILASRMPRLSWKYQSIAYALTLKHVGILLQSMYLNATAMDLGGCAIGTGDMQQFAEASGKDPLQECSVGEFLLGSRS